MEPSSDLINDDPEENRALAAHMTDLYRSMFNAATDATVQVAKWLLASLLAVNGAAGIAVWQGSLPSEYKIAASTWFVAGILAALTSGLWQLSSYSALAKPLGEHIGYWITVQSDGHRVAELEDTANIAAAGRKAARGPLILGWISVLSFLIGIGAAGYGLLNSVG